MLQHCEHKVAGRRYCTSVIPWCMLRGELGHDRRDGKHSRVARTQHYRSLSHPETLRFVTSAAPAPCMPFALPCHSGRFDQPGSFVGGGYAGAVAPAGRRMPGVMLAEDAAFQPWQETPWSGRATQGLDAQGQDW
jgi:hypothetical protein